MHTYDQKSLRHTFAVLVIIAAEIGIGDAECEIRGAFYLVPVGVAAARSRRKFHFSASSYGKLSIPVERFDVCQSRHTGQ